MAGPLFAPTLGVALVGAGYWGSRLARNLAAAPTCSLQWVCDLDRARATAVAAPFGARVAGSLAEVLDDPSVVGVVVATPASTHRNIVRAALEADRHLLVEKPLAGSVDDARGLADLARDRGLTVMCDHTYRFAPAVGLIRDLIATDAPGPLRSAVSVRTNHHHAQPDVDVFWDLAHHDLSILTFVLPATSQPVAISARSTDLLGIGRADAGDLAVHLTDGATAHVHVDWSAPQKVRTMAFAGDAGVLTWEDLNPAGPQIELAQRDKVQRIRVDDDREPLALVVHEFLTALAERRAPSCGPTEEISVLNLLEVATRSDADDGAVVPVDVLAPDPLPMMP